MEVSRFGTNRLSDVDVIAESWGTVLAKDEDEFFVFLVSTFEWRNYNWLDGLAVYLSSEEAGIVRQELTEQSLDRHAPMPFTDGPLRKLLTERI